MERGSRCPETCPASPRQQHGVAGASRLPWDSELRLPPPCSAPLGSQDFRTLKASHARSHSALKSPHHAHSCSLGLTSLPRFSGLKHRMLRGWWWELMVGLKAPSSHMDRHGVAPKQTGPNSTSFLWKMRLRLPSAGHHYPVRTTSGGQLVKPMCCNTPDQAFGGTSAGGPQICRLNQHPGLYYGTSVTRYPRTTQWFLPWPSCFTSLFHLLLPKHVAFGAPQKCCTPVTFPSEIAFFSVFHFHLTIITVINLHFKLPFILQELQYLNLHRVEK